VLRSGTEARPFGLKGAALAALGDSPTALVAEPLTDREVELRDAGVKLGESTFNLFLTLR